MQNNQNIPTVPVTLTHKPAIQTETCEERTARIAREARQWMAENAWMA